MQAEQEGNRLLEFVRKYLLIKEAKCYRHCEKLASFVPLSQNGSSLVGGYVCPQNYVSRVVYFAESPDPDTFERFLSDQLGTDRLRHRDIRSATRYGWELGGNAEDEIKKVSRSNNIKQYYWTFYARSEEDKKYGTFLCPKESGGCGRLYTKLQQDGSQLCPDCSKKI